MRFLSRTPVRTFFIYPVLIFAWQLIRNRGSTSSRCSCRSWHGLPAVPALWSYRIKHGGGGPGFETPPNRLISTGPYGYRPQSEYLGHLIYLLGLSLTLRSWLGAVITIAVALWFRRRVIGDEKKLSNHARQALREVYEESATLDLKEQSWR